MDSTWDLVHEYLPRKVKYQGKKRMTAQIIVDPVFEVEKIKAILDAQDTLQKDERKNVLVILDDVADALPRAHNNILERLFFRGRHAKVWCWLSSQAYKRVPRNIRLNSPYYVFWAARASELDTITQELSVEDDPKDFKRIFHQATDPQFGFLTIDAKVPRSDRYTSSFTKI